MEEKKERKKFEERPLDKEFIDLVINGETKSDAFRMCFPDECKDKEDKQITAAAKRRFETKNNLTYYLENSDGDNDIELYGYKNDDYQPKEAIVHYKRMQKYAEDKIYKEGVKPNVAMVQLWVNASKGLDMVKGLYEKKVTVDIKPISISFEGLAKLNDKGEIVDADYKEVKEEITEKVKEIAEKNSVVEKEAKNE